MRRMIAAFAAVALSLPGVAMAVDETWDYQFPSDGFFDSGLKPWSRIFHEKASSQAVDDGIRLESGADSSLFYRLTASPWESAPRHTVDFEVAVEEVDATVESGTQLVVADGSFRYIVRLPEGEMSRYRLVTDEGSAFLYKNGEFFASASKDSFETSPYLLKPQPADESMIYFGDGSASVGGTALWKSLAFVNGKALHPDAGAVSPNAGAPLALAQPTVTIDPRTRYPHLRYQIPEGAPESVRVMSSFRVGEGEWTRADVWPLLSVTGWGMAPEGERKAWRNGEVTERSAAGKSRELIWFPYTHLPGVGSQKVEFRLEMLSDRNERIAETTFAIALENEGVKVIAKTATMPPSSENERAAKAFVTGPDVEGAYAIFLGEGSKAWVGIGTQPMVRVVSGPPPGSEIDLGVHHLKPDGLAFLPVPTGTGTAGRVLNSIRLVPVKEAPKEAKTTPVGERKILAGYFEPYSWAFWRLVESPSDYVHPVRVYQANGFTLMDTQLGRFGSRILYESKAAAADRFLERETVGDQGGKEGKRSRSFKVWSMVDKTAPLRDLLAAADSTGEGGKMTVFANFGVTNCYPGMGLESDFAKKHPELRRKNGNFLTFAEPKVQEYMLSLYREVLDAGAPGISLDFCRYPYGVDAAKDVTLFLRKLRALADEYEGRRTVLIRFPAKGERRSEHFDFRSWAKEGLVDYLCPSNIFATVLHFDVAPYVEAARGTASKVLPVIDVMPVGPFAQPGPLLRRAAEIYRAGADGIYLYQPDAYVFRRTTLPDYLPLLDDPAGIEACLREMEENRSVMSKKIYILPPAHPFLGGYRPSGDRIRFWLEGDIGPELEVWEGDKKLAALKGYPYVLGEEATDAPEPFETGRHELRVRARDGDGWLEHTFRVTSVPTHNWDEVPD